jgi:type IV secretion system protein VirB10
MLGVAALIVGIILVTGHRQAPEGPRAVGPASSPALSPPDRIRQFERQLADDEARLRQFADRAAETPARGATASRPTMTDPSVDEQRRRDDQSLFADNVAFSRRGVAVPAAGPAAAWELSYPQAAPAGNELPTPTLEDLARLEENLLRLASAAPIPPPPAQNAVPPADAERPAPGISPPTQTPAAAPEPPTPASDRVRLLEGTVIETVLLTRLDGTFAGPITCLVTTPVYSIDGQRLVVPAGARVLGRASPVQGWGDARLAVSFHRLVMPDGRTHSLDRFTGLSQTGATGLSDQVDRHYLQLFGASLAVGGLSGLAQFNTRSGVDMTFGDAYRQSAGASLANSTGRILDRYLNVLPTVTIREGYRIKVYLTSDLDLPPYRPSGGDR